MYQGGSQRGVQDFPVRTGRVWFNPYSTRIVEYPTYMQTVQWTHDTNEGHPYNEEFSFTTKDSMTVRADVSASYSFPDDRKVPAFYVKFRTDDLERFTHGFLKNAARNCMNDEAGLYAVEQIMGDNSKWLKDTKDCLQSQVTQYGVSIDQFGIIGAPRPPDQVISAINMKVQAAQIALQKQNEVAQVEADARKKVAQAEGEAKARIAKAEGEAKANQALTASINPNLLEWRRLDITEHKWNGELPTYYNSGGNPGLLINIPTAK